MKKLICALMIFAVMLGITACGTKSMEDTAKSLEGTWTTADKESGYNFEEFGVITLRDEKMGQVNVLPNNNGFLQAAISYYYHLTDDNKIEIICISPMFSYGGVSVSEEQYDVLRIEKKNGERVLISENSGIYYYLEK